MFCLPSAVSQTGQTTVVSRLPEPLRNANPLGLSRLVDGVRTAAPLS